MHWKGAVHSVWILGVFLLFAASTWADPVRSDVEAQGLVRGLLAGRTPPLDVGAVREAGQSYEVEVVTPGGSLVDRLLVDKAGGRVRSLYGQTLLSFQPAAGSMGMLGGGGGVIGPMGGDGLP